MLMSPIFNMDDWRKFLEVRFKDENREIKLGLVDC